MTWTTSQLLCLQYSPTPQRRLATIADVELAIAEAWVSGSFFLADIKRNQVIAGGGAFSPLDTTTLINHPDLSHFLDLDQTLYDLALAQ